MIRNSNIQRFVISLFVVFSVCPAWLYAKPVDKDKASKAAKAFLKIEQVRHEKQEEKLVKEGKRILRDIRKHRPQSTTSIYGDNNRILAYVIELEPEGYIVTSPDDRIKPIIAYSFKGKFPVQDSRDNVLLHLVQWDMEARLKAYNNDSAFTAKNTQEWDSYAGDEIQPMSDIVMAATSSSQTQWPDPSTYGSDGWIKTNWNQRYGIDPPYFNGVCPIGIDGGSHTFTGRNYRCSVGCTALATAQIVNYWKYPRSIAFDESDEYTSLGKLLKTDDEGVPLVGKYTFWSKPIDIDNDSADYGFASLSTLDLRLSDISYNNDYDEIADLCFGIGVKLKSDYGMNSTGANMRSVPMVLLTELNYGSARQSRDWFAVKDRVIQNMKNEMPVEIGLAYYDSVTGWALWNWHSAIIDGYDSLTGHFHVNLGSYKSGDNTWYNLPSISPPNWNITWNAINAIIYDISPYSGWHQYGADEQNTFRAIYPAPTEDAMKDKWSVTCPRSNLEFTGLVVASGNRIFVSASTKIQNEGNPSYVYVYDPYGSKPIKEIAFSSSDDEGLTAPVASSNGKYVYVGSGKGNVYRITADSKTFARTTYSNIGEGEGFIRQPKIDKNGDIYLQTLYKHYCVTSSGSVKWSFPHPYGGTFAIDQGCTIDSENGWVYIPYFDSSTNRSYLSQRYISSGGNRQTVYFSVPSSSYRSGTPSLLSSGDVVIGVSRSLYILDKDSLTSVLGYRDWSGWTSGGTTFRHFTPAIGRDDTIYIPQYYTDTIRRFYALNADSTLSAKWYKSLAVDSEFDSIQQPYVASNDIVVFTCLLENGSSADTFTLYAVRDNGISYSDVWSFPYGNQRADLAFGPGQTIYRVGDNKLYCICDGDRGDPESGGMAWTDNTQPEAPTLSSPVDGSGDIGATATLTWAGSDPDGHSLKYSLYVGESGYDMVPIATGLSSPSYQLSGLKSLTGYRWMIAATDGQSVNESDTHTFTTKEIADINLDRKVNLVDYADLSGKWQFCDCNDLNYWCDLADIDHSGVVDFNDLGFMAEQWLEGTGPSEPDGMVWVYIDDFGVPTHEPFCGYMSKYETTNAQYCQFLNAALATGDIRIGANSIVYGASGSNSGTDFLDEPYYDTEGAGNTTDGATDGGAARIHWMGSSFYVESGFENHPVTHVSWYGATAFCGYYGWRLPTEWEWQAVADYDGSYIYGCGATIDNSIANYSGSTHLDGTTQVGAFGAYGYDLCDMSGNAWEVTSDCVLRGGGWKSNSFSCMVMFQNYNVLPSTMGYDNGFRACRGQ